MSSQVKSAHQTATCTVRTDTFPCSIKVTCCPQQLSISRCMQGVTPWQTRTCSCCTGSHFEGCALDNSTHMHSQGMREMSMHTTDTRAVALFLTGRCTQAWKPISALQATRKLPILKALSSKALLRSSTCRA